MTTTALRTSPRMVPRALFVLACALATAIAACGGDSATGPTSAVGVWALSTINGKALPFRMFADTGFSVDITQSTIDLKTDGSFVSTLRSEERVENHLSVYADTGTGRWAVSGATLTFTAPDSSKQSAAFDGSSITLADSSTVVPLTLVYTRR